MMDEKKVIIRPMNDGEQKEIVQIGRRAFQFIEALFVGTPKQAMVVEYEGKIVGSASYNYISISDKKIGYLDQGFVDPAFSGSGIGKMLYTHTINHLWSQGCYAVTAIVKDDNVGSWKLLEANRLKRVSYHQIIKELGFPGFIKLYFCTPLPFTVGTDFYMASDMPFVSGKNHTVTEFISFFLANILLLFPLWIRMSFQNRDIFPWIFLGYITVLMLFVFGRYIGNLICGNKAIFRRNRGCDFLTMLLSLSGNTYPINANWYPEKYENTGEFRRKLAVPELIKWMIFLIIPFMSSMWRGNPYWSAVGGFSYRYLFFMCIPVYPFEAFGGGRVFNYSKKIWLLFVIITVLEFVFALVKFF